MIDLGLRHSVLRQLIARGCNVTVVPYSVKLKELKDLQPDGIILSSGPGNPHHIDGICQVIAKIDPHIPIMGIGLGAELLALAHGGSLTKLKSPHRGLNIPVKRWLLEKSKSLARITSTTSNAILFHEIF